MTSMSNFNSSYLASSLAFPQIAAKLMQHSYPVTIPIIKGPSLEGFGTKAMNSDACASESLQEFTKTYLRMNEETKSNLLPSSKKIQKMSPKKENDQETSSETKKSNFPVSGVKKVHWNSSEDSQVLELINRMGKKWTKIANIIGNRSGKQVRDRYLNYLRPNIKMHTFTAEEDESLLALYREFGNKWCKIAAYIPGRTECQVKNRFYSNLKNKVKFPKKKSVVSASTDETTTTPMSQNDASKVKSEMELEQPEKDKSEILSEEESVSSVDRSSPKMVEPKIEHEIEAKSNIFSQKAGLCENINKKMELINNPMNTSYMKDMMTEMKNNQLFAPNVQNVPSKTPVDLYKENLLKAQMKLDDQVKNYFAFAKNQALASLNQQLNLEKKVSRYQELVRTKEAYCFAYFQIAQEMTQLASEIFQEQKPLNQQN